MLVGASVALIFLIIQMIFALLVVFTLLAGMVFGMYKLRQVIARFMPKAQAFTQQVADGTRMVCNRVAAPFIWANSMAVNVRHTARAAQRRVSR